MKFKKYFSKQCYILLAAIFLFLMAGYFHSNNIAYLVGFFLISFLMAFAILGCMNIKRVNFDVLFPKKIFVNTPFDLVLKFKAKVYDIYINNTHFKIAENTKTLPFVIKKRGYYFLDELEVISTFPACNKFIKKIKVNKKILVYPEIKGESLKNFISKEVSKGADEFDSLKSYEGEGLNLIHWGSVAKGEVLSKKFSSLNESKEFIFDYSKIKGDKEFRLSQLTKWILEAEKAGFKYTVILDKKILNGNSDEILKTLSLY